VQGDLVALLAERSRGRVDSSSAFAEVREQIAEAAESDGVVVVSELLKESKEADASAVDGGAGVDAGAGTEEPADEEAAEKPTPQLEEALAVLSDLVILGGQRAASRDAARPES
jgi:hypothetical protein